jgi:hypothetical protein
VIGMLMGHHHRIKIGQAVPRVAEVPRSIRIRASSVSASTAEWPKWVIRISPLGDGRPAECGPGG